MLNIHKYVYFILTIVLVGLNLALCDKKLCADPRCENSISLGLSLLRYSASEKGMVSFNPNSPIRVMSKSAESDNKFWEIEVDGKRGYAPIKFIKETKILVPRGQLVYVEQSDVQESNVEIEPATTAQLKESDSTERDANVVVTEANIAKQILSEKSNIGGVESIPLREEIETDHKSQILSNIDNSIKTVETAFSEANDNIALGNTKLDNSEIEQQVNIENLKNGQINENYINPTILPAIEKANEFIVEDNTNYEAATPNDVKKNIILLSDSETKESINNIGQNILLDSKTVTGDIEINTLENHNIPIEELQYPKSQTENPVREETIDYSSLNNFEIDAKQIRESGKTGTDPSNNGYINENTITEQDFLNIIPKKDNGIKSDKPNSDDSNVTSNDLHQNFPQSSETSIQNEQKQENIEMIVPPIIGEPTSDPIKNDNVHIENVKENLNMIENESNENANLESENNTQTDGLPSQNYLAAQQFLSEKSNNGGVESIPLGKEIETDHKSQILSNIDNSIKTVETTFSEVNDNIVLGDTKLDNSEIHNPIGKPIENFKQHNTETFIKQDVDSQETQGNGEHAQQINIENLKYQINENINPTLLPAIERANEFIVGDNANNEAATSNDPNKNNILLSDSETKESINNIEQNILLDSKTVTGDIEINTLENHNIPIEELQYPKSQPENPVREETIDYSSLNNFEIEAKQIRESEKTGTDPSNNGYINENTITEQDFLNIPPKKDNGIKSDKPNPDDSKVTSNDLHQNYPQSSEKSIQNEQGSALYEKQENIEMIVPPIIGEPISDPIKNDNVHIENVKENLNIKQNENNEYDSRTTTHAEIIHSADLYATGFTTPNSIDQSQTQSMEQNPTINVTPLPFYNPSSSKNEENFNDLSSRSHYNAFGNDEDKPTEIYQMHAEVGGREVNSASNHQKEINNIDFLHITTPDPIPAQPEMPILNHDFITESPILSANENKNVDNEITNDDSNLHTAPAPASVSQFPYSHSPSDLNHEPEGLFATIVTTVNNLLLNKKEGKYISNHVDVDKLQRNVFLRPKASKNKYRQDRPASGENCNCEVSHEGCEILKMPSDNLFDFFLVKILEARDLILCLTITGAVALFFVFGYYCFCNSNQESILLSKLNSMERSVLTLHTENDILKEDLVRTRHKLLSIEDNSFGSNDMVISLKKELDDVVIEKIKLQEHIISLEKELENAAEAGLELNKIVSELLSNQTGDESIISSVEELQKQLNEQQNTIYEINNKLSEKSRENSELQLMIAEQNARLSAQIATLQEDNDELDTEKTNLQTRMENLKIEFEQDITKALEGKNFEIKRLQSEITESKSKQEDSNMKLQTSLAKIEALEECLRTMKKNPGTNMSEVIDIVNIRGELLNMQKQNTILKERFESETDNTKLLETQLKIALEEVERLKQEFNQSEKDKLEAQTRLEVLSNYFRDKETQLQKDLSLKETIWLKQQGETTSTVERLTAMQEEVQSLKSQNDSLRAEIEAQMAAYKAQTGTLENRAHETWLAARQSERKYEEARAEATALRRKLTALANSNANESISDNLNSDINNAPSPILMEAPSSPMLGRLPPPPFLPPPFLGPPPPFMGIPPPFVQPGEMRPAPLGRLMSPPPPPTGSPQHPQHHARSGRYTPEHLVYDEYYDDEDDDELDHRRRRDSWHRNSYSPTRTYRSNSPSDSRYNYSVDRDIISNYDTETDFSPPPSPRERRSRGSRSSSYKAYSPQPNTSPKEIKSDKKSLKGALSSSSEKSFISSQNERKGKSMV